MPRLVPAAGSAWVGKSRLGWDLDHAGHLLRTDGDQAAWTATDETRDIADRLCCRSLLDRAADLSRQDHGSEPPMVTAPGPEEPVAGCDG